ncbi:MAG: hypothetical protein M1830_007216 [Pleopsidium flavum]|nr:MAG: hypothetical protein M1830_007216 [Pleopsidium flavum]
MFALLAIASILSLSSAIALQPRSSVVACNNSPDLCSRSYSKITHLGAHDSAFVRDASTGYSLGGNQFYNATAQLNAGVRLLTAQVHNNNGLLHLCHTSCALLDAGRVSDWLAVIRIWLDNNPNDVVTILLVNSDNTSAVDLNAEFQAAKITSYAYTPPSTATALVTWPTLQDLISSSTRLVTFIAPLNPVSNTAAPYLLDEFTFVWENPYDVLSPSNFSCAPDRPPLVKGDTSAAVKSGRMALMNHFLYSPGPFDLEVPDTADVMNTNAPSGGIGNLGDRAANCTSLYGKAPTFILVDFFDQGPAIATVDKLNGITPMGRTQPGMSNTAKSATSAGSRGRDNIFKGLVDLPNTVRAGVKPSIGKWIWAGSDWGTVLGGIEI